MAVLERACEESPRPIREVNAHLPAWLAELISRLHAKAPAGRPGSAQEVAESLARRLAELQDGEIAQRGTVAPRQEGTAVEGRRGGHVRALDRLVLGEVTGVKRVRNAVSRVLRGSSVAIGGDRGPAVVRGPVTDADAAAAAWEQAPSGLLPDEHAQAVAARLKLLNPRFDGAFTHQAEGKDVTDFRFSSEQVTDMSPVRALRNLKNLQCGGTPANWGLRADLSPLSGLPLKALYFQNCRISELSPLTGMALGALDFSNTLVSDLSPLKGMRLSHLVLSNTRVWDLSTLRGMPIRLLLAEGVAVSNISVLRGMSIEYLGLHRTRVSDLAPLSGMPSNT